VPGHEHCAQASHQASSSPTLAALNNSGGIVRALDRGEWFIDTAAQQIYVRTPSGQRPAAGQSKPSGARMGSISTVTAI
jgi:hypothetical protein